MTYGASAPRPAGRPAGRPAIHMRWQNLAFLHWPVPVEAVRPLVPPGLEIETYGGSAFVGLLPFTMPLFRHAWLPPIPTARCFHECNVRTYVSVGGEPGVYFFSLDAASRLAVWGARRFWRLNYEHARMTMTRVDGSIEYAVDRPGPPRARLRCRWTPGDRLPQSEPGDLAHFVTERYMLYTTDAAGRAMRSRIWHEPWQLREASVLWREILGPRTPRGPDQRPFDVREWESAARTIGATAAEMRGLTAAVHDLAELLVGYLTELTGLSDSDGTIN